MNDGMIAWLGGVGAWVWQTCVLLLVVVNVLAVAVVSVTRDRGIVNRWTGRWLGANVALIGAGVGIPAVTGLLRLGLSALPTFGATAVHLPK